MASDVFISYASEDRERVAPLAAGLQAAGLTVWWDRQIRAGRQFDHEIEAALDSAAAVVVCWTASSVASEWVRNEAAAGAERNVLVPVMLEAVRLPLEFRRRQALDLSKWNGEADAPEVAELAAAVRAAPGGHAPPLPATRPPASRRGALTAGAAALLLAGGGWALWRRRPDEAPAPAPSPTPAAADLPVLARLYDGDMMVARAMFTPRGFLVTMRHALPARRPVRIVWNDGQREHEALVDLLRAAPINLEVVLLQLSNVWPAPQYPFKVRIARTLQPGEAIERFVSATDRAPGTVKEVFGRREVADGGAGLTMNQVLVTTSISAPGDSGVPVLDKQGAVVGLIFGGSREETISVMIEDVTASFPEAF